MTAALDTPPGYGPMCVRCPDVPLIFSAPPWTSHRRFLASCPRCGRILVLTFRVLRVVNRGERDIAGSLVSACR